MLVKAVPNKIRNKRTQGFVKAWKAVGNANNKSKLVRQCGLMRAK
jgi:hypothetical protein